MAGQGQKSLRCPPLKQGRLWEEPTEEIGPTSDSVGILAVCGGEDVKGRSFIGRPRQAERRRLRSRKVLNPPSEINDQESSDFSARILVQDLVRQLELHRNLCLNLDRFTVEQIRFVLPLLHRLNRGV